MARYPVDSPVRIISDYGVRVKPGGGMLQGHWGVDIGGAAGDRVVAPEGMRVTAVWTDDKTPPYVGYGPGGIEAAGESGVYHLLGHLDPARIAVAPGDDVLEGVQVGAVSTLLHVHWEVRKIEVDNPSTREGDTFNPTQWLDATDPNWRQHQRLVFTTPSAGAPWWVWAAAIFWLARRGR